MTATFFKYQGTGNDFIMIDNRQLFFPKIDDKFVVGYGLDYDELGRNLAALYVLEK